MNRQSSRLVEKNKETMVSQSMNGNIRPLKNYSPPPRVKSLHKVLVSLIFQLQHLNNGYKNSSRRPCQGNFRQLYFEEKL